MPDAEAAKLRAEIQRCVVNRCLATVTSRFFAAPPPPRGRRRFGCWLTKPCVALPPSLSHLLCVIARAGCSEYLAAFQKTVAMHEAFLMRLSMHPVFREDENLQVFLEYDEDVSPACPGRSPSILLLARPPRGWVVMEAAGRVITRCRRSAWRV